MFFSRVFEELRLRYISSDEFGLDSYLSVRIRHGTISGQIRSPFEALDLVTRKSASTGDYTSNTHWEADFGSLRDGLLTLADRHFREFSSTVDATIELVKTVWIQIRSDDKPDGVFDFRYSLDDVRRLYRALPTIVSSQDLLAVVFRELSSRLEVNLEKMRHLIETRLTSDLLAALSRLQSQLIALEPRLRASTFASAVTRCRTDIQNEMAALAAWFRLVDEKAIANYPFGDLLDTVVTLVSRTSPTTHLMVHKDVRIVEECKGSSFTGMFDALRLLLDNAVRHGHDSPQIAVSAWSSGEYFDIEVSNQLAPGADIVAARTKIYQLKESLAAMRRRDSAGSVRREGGSGFFKLHKLLRYDLALGDNYTATWWVTDDRRFVAHVKLGAKDVMACGC